VQKGKQVVKIDAFKLDIKSSFMANIANIAAYFAILGDLQKTLTNALSGLIHLADDRPVLPCPMASI
jgi:hypothetical protein